MFFTIFDLILILILFLFIAFGFALGLIQTIGALVGVIVGAWVAMQYSESFAQWLNPFLLGHSGAARIIAFIVLFVLINRLIGLVFHLADKIFHLFSFIPFTKSISRLLGALFGFLEGTLTIGVTLNFIAALAISEWFGGILDASAVAQWFMAMANVLTPLLPSLNR